MLLQKLVVRHWLSKRARTTAVWGNCPKTVASMRSGVARWCIYIGIRKGSEAEPLPVDMQDILGHWHSVALVLSQSTWVMFEVLPAPLGTSLRRLGIHRFAELWVRLQSVCGTAPGRSSQYRELS